MSDELIMVPFPRTIIWGAETVAVITQPDVAMRPRYLVVPKSIAPDFMINDLKIGRHSQLYAEGEVPAEVFSGNVVALDARETEPSFLRKAELDHPIPLRIDTCDRETPISLLVLNINARGRYFMAVLFGKKVE